MEGRDAMAFPETETFAFYSSNRGGGAFTSISPSQSANAFHAPPGLGPISNFTPLSSSGYHPFPIGEQSHQDFTHGFYMGMMAPSPPTMQQPPPSHPPPPMEPVVKKKRGRPRKHVPDNQVDLGLSPMPKTSSSSSSMSNPNAPKRGRPPGTGKKQRLANLGELLSTTAGLDFATHVIDVEAGEDIVSEVLSFSQQRQRALYIMSASGKVSSVTLRVPGSSDPTYSFEGLYDILSLGGSYLVNDEVGPTSRIGGISVCFSHPDGYPVAGGVRELIAASLVEVVVCSFVYGSPKAKTIEQEKGSKEEKAKMGTTPNSEGSPPTATEPAEEEEGEATGMTRGWSGGGGGSRSVDSRNLDHQTDIDLTRG